MNDLIERALRLFPQYFEDLVRLVTSPKRFIARKLSQDRVFEQAFVFLGISYAFGFILGAPLQPGNLWIDFAASAAFTVIQAVGYGTAIWLAWRAVGGNGKLASDLVVTLYYTAVIGLIMTLSYFVVLGTLRMVDPGLYDGFFDAARKGTMPQFVLARSRAGLSSGVLAVVVEVPVLLMLLGAWLIAGWGAYRASHHVARARSILAFALFVILSLPVTALTFLIANALAAALP